MSDEKADAPLVLVTGASGFIAKWIVKQLLDSNKYRVRGTVRSVEKWTKILSALASPDHKYKLELVSVDLMEDAGWSDAMKGVDFCLHTASPLPVDQPKDAEELIRPAKGGLERAFKAARAAGVKKFVMTSSCAAIYPGNQDMMNDKGVADFTEEHWSKESGCEPYSLSKLLAERHFWALHKEDPESKMECMAICPSLVLGPLWEGRSNASQEPLRLLLEGEVPACPRTFMPCVDVRNVAEAHIRALEKDGINGKRYILNESTVAFVELAKILHDAGYDVPTSQAPDFLMKVMSLCDETVRVFVVPVLGYNMQLHNDAAQNELGIKFIPTKDAVLAMAGDMVKHGLVKKKQPK